MKSLSKPQRAEKSKLELKLADAADAVQKAVDAYNSEVAEAFSKLKDEVEAYESIVQEARDFMDNIHADMQAYFDDKSEKWQEGDSGSSYQTWMDTWEESFDVAEVDEPEELNIECSAVEVFTELPEEVE